MAKISLLLFGYRKIVISSEDQGFVMAQLLRQGIVAYWQSKDTFLIHERDFTGFRSAFSKKHDYQYSGCLGLFGFFKNLNNKAGVLVGIILSALLLILSANTVWDIRVEGNEKISEARVVEELKKQGFEIGRGWSFLNRSRIENGILNDFEEISWININRAGSVAIIKVIENENPNEKNKADSGYKYSNIVAKKDCVIEEISVKRGTAMVKAGDAVKAGDILISGVIESGSNIAFCSAEGTVKGRCYDRAETFIERKYTKKTPSEEVLCELNIILFNFKINIFKKYRNLSVDCDIIKERKIITAQNGVKIPLFIDKTFAQGYIISEEEYTDAELVELASKRLRAKTSGLLSDSDLISIKTGGRFEENGYYMYSDIVMSKSIGVSREFTVE